MWNTAIWQVFELVENRTAWSEIRLSWRIFHHRVLADKTFCGNDDMEETGVLPKEKSNNTNTDFSSQRNDSNLLYNKTIVGNEDMEVTKILPNPQAGQVKDREAFRTLVESLVQMTTFISRIFLKLVELQKLIRLFCWNYMFYIITFQKIRQIKALRRHFKL